MSICKDCFHSYVCEQFNEQRECDNKKCHFANDHFISADQINRLQSENERLRNAYKQCAFERDAYIEIGNTAIAEAKAEAYKEFSEKLHEELRMYGTKDKFNKAVFLNVVDRAKKELVGEDK